MGSATEIQVSRRRKDGWYVYTCDDLPGLYVASQSDREAYEDVPRAIEMLFRLDLGAAVRVLHKLPYDSFVQTLSPASRAADIVAERTADLMGDEPSTISYVVGSLDDNHPE